MKKSLHIKKNEKNITSGTYKEDYGRVLLPNSITEIQEGAFPDECTASFWVVKNSYASYRIGEICPNAKVILFDCMKDMEDAWENYRQVRSVWRKVRKAVTESEIRNITRASGWTYEEAYARYVKCFLEKGTSIEDYAAVSWMAYYREDPNRPTKDNWIAWRKNEIDKMLASSKTGVRNDDFDLSVAVPMRISARRYTAMHKIGEEIREKRITFGTLCDFFDVDIPENLKDERDRIIPSIAYNHCFWKKDCVAFCAKERDIKPEKIKELGVFAVFGNIKYEEVFKKQGINYIPVPRLEGVEFELAMIWRSQYPKAKTICITGSVGKTTTTAMTNHVVMSAFKSICIWTNRNLQSHCANYTEDLDDETCVWVQESAGTGVKMMEIASRILRPDIFIVTNVGTGHIGRHGGSRASLLYEKTTCDRQSPKDALGILNYDDELLPKYAYNHEIAWFSLHNPKADFHAENITEKGGILSFDVVEKDGVRTPVEIHAIGIHNIYDALAAFIAGIRLGIDRERIAKALNTYRAQGVRQHLVEAAGRRFFVDCYSCTYDSVVSSIKNAASFEVKNGGKKCIVLCDIPDLGHKSEEIHLNIGKLVRESDQIDEVFFYGYLIKPAYEAAVGGKPAVRYTNSRNELEKWISETTKEDVVIFKSSHKVELHRIVDDIIGTTFHAEDLRSGVVRNPRIGSIHYKNVKDYGSCAMEMSEYTETVHTVQKARNMMVRMIAPKAFAETDVKEVLLESPLITIGDEAFSSCKKLKSVRLSKTLYYIGTGAFRNCSSLEEIEIPKGTATISSFAFAGCTSLKRVKLPASICTIGEKAFDEKCTAVFECVRDSYASEVIARMCPEASVELCDAQADDVCLPMPDMSKFIKEDLVYTADNNIETGNGVLPTGTAKVKAEQTDKAFDEVNEAASAAPIIYADTESVDIADLDNAGENSVISEVTIACTGDSSLGKGYSMTDEYDWEEFYGKKGAEHFLSGTSDVLKNSDIAITNLECVLTDNPKRQEKFYRQKNNRIDDRMYSHLGKPEYLQALTLGGINAVTFANNHNIDYGINGYHDTIEACKKYGVPMAHYDKIVRKKVGDIQVGIISVDFTYCNSKIAEGILIKAIADARRDCNLVVVCPHWGHNYKEELDEVQRKDGRLCIDLGADVVFGCHPHILQGVERYKGKYIYYSIGNFCYGGRKIPIDNDTLIVKQKFTFVDGKVADTDDVTLIPCHLSQNPNNNDYRPVIVKDEDAKAIIDKVNARSSEFGMKFGYDGRPEVEKTTEHRNEVISSAYHEEVPDIIYTLTDYFE